MARVIPILVLIALTIYCIVEVAQSRPSQVRKMPKWLWAAVVICVPLCGPIAWLVFGRPIAQPPPRKIIPPDDDPDFLRSL